jgi:uncharacterized protein YbjT (DUF2867 family)
VAALQALGLPCVAAGIQPARIKAQLGAHIETRALDLSEPRTYDEAVRGMRGLFLLRPPAISDVARTLNVLCDRAIAAGVAHITFLSVDGAEKQSWVPHHAVEQHLSACGVSTTLLRAGFFAQNLGDAYRRDIREDDRLYVPTGNGRVAFVDVRDVAELAARSFTEAGLRRQAFRLTGPAAVGFAEVAALLSACLGRPIAYCPASIVGYIAHLRRRRLPWIHIAVQTLLHVGLRLDNAATVDPTLGQLLGRPARAIEQYIQDCHALWGRDREADGTVRGTQSS